MRQHHESFTALLQRSVDHDPAKYHELQRMGMGDVVPFVERWLEKVIDAQEQARKSRRK